MRDLILIILISTILFFTLAIIEDWQNFKSLFFKKEIKKIEFPEEILKTIDNFNTLLEHIYRFEGDERFLQRLPASDFLKEEILEDLYYLYSYQIIQEIKLKKIEILKKNLINENQAIVSTSEEWELYYKDINGHPLLKKPMDFSINNDYYLRKTVLGWLVEKIEI